MKRTKEELIQAQQREAESDWAEGAGNLLGAAIVDLAAGCAAGAPDALAVTAGWYWKRDALARFDLRRVDEQGRLIEAGWLALPAAPEARNCLALTAPGEQCQAPATHAGHGQESPRCFAHAPERYKPIREVCLTWMAGDHLDDVLRAGAERVAALARAALAKPEPLPENIAAAVSVLKPGELLVLNVPPQTTGGNLDALCRRLETVLPAMGSKGLLLEGPVTRESVEHLRERLRAVGFDVVPRIRTERPPKPHGPGRAARNAYLASQVPLKDVDMGPFTDPREEVTCCCSRAVPKASAFASSSGWRCASCTASEALGALNDIAGMLDLPAGGDLPKVVPTAARHVLTAAAGLIRKARGWFSAAAGTLSGEQRVAIEDAFRPLVMALADPTGELRAISHRIAQEGLDAIANDFGTEPTSLEELQKRSILTVSGGVVAEETAKKPAPLFERHRHGEHHKVLVLEAEPGQRGSLVVKLPSGREVLFEGGQRLLVEAVLREAIEAGASREEVAKRLSEALSETLDTTERRITAAAERVSRGLGGGPWKTRERATERLVTRAMLCDGGAALNEDTLLGEIEQAIGRRLGDLRGVGTLTAEEVDMAAMRLGVTSQALLDQLHKMVDHALRGLGAGPHS